MLTKINRNEEKVILKLRELPAGRKNEVIDFIDFLVTSRGMVKGKKEAEEYSYYLQKLRKKIQKRGGLGLGSSPEKILQSLRKTRESVWKEEYENHFGLK